MGTTASDKPLKLCITSSLLTVIW